MFLGLGATIAGLVWTVWGWSVQLREMHVNVSDRTETFVEGGLVLVVIGIVLMIVSRTQQKDP